MCFVKFDRKYLESRESNIVIHKFLDACNSKINEEEIFFILSQYRVDKTFLDFDNNNEGGSDLDAERHFKHFKIRARCY